MAEELAKHVERKRRTYVSLRMSNRFRFAVELGGFCRFGRPRILCTLWFARANFVGGGIAGALEGAPHVPAGDGAVGAPAFAEGEKFFWAGLVLFAGGDGPAFLHA